MFISMRCFSPTFREESIARLAHFATGAQITQRMCPNDIIPDIVY